MNFKAKLRKGLLLLGSLLSVVVYSQVSRQPYLQVTTPTSVIVRWNTESSSVGKVSYGLSIDAQSNSAVESDTGTFHKVTLSELAPATRYYYTIDSLGSSEDQYFVTLPLPGNKGKSRIWVISDFGQTSFSQDAVRRQTVDRWKNFNNDSYHADLVLSLGDQSENDIQEELQPLFFDPLSQVLLNSPLYTIQGNHDNYDGLVNYRATFSLPANAEAGGYPSNNQDYYSLDYGNVHIIALSTEIDDIDGAQLSWLRNDLQNINKDKTDWLIALLHRPFHSGGYHPTDISSTAQKQRTYWLKELEKYGVDLILSGHNAIYERSFLLNNLIGKTTDIKNENIIDRGDGKEDGDGPYIKRAGLNNSKGTVFIEVAPGGDAVKNNANYSIFSSIFSGTDKEGSVVVDVDSSNRMDVYFLCNIPDKDGKNVWDYFTILKSDSLAEERASMTAEQIHYSIINNTSVTFDWVGSSDRIFYGTDSSSLLEYKNSVHPDFLPVSSPWISDPGPYHEVKLTGLLENKEYYYKIGNSGQVNKFRTPPSPGTGGFRVCSTSDSHSSSSECVAIFNQIGSLKPDLVITTGDLTGAGPAGQQEVAIRFNSAMGFSKNAAWMPCIGNHDWEYTDFDDLRTFKGRFDIPNPQASASSPAISCCGEDWGWFDYGNTRFISLPERWSSSTTWQDWSRDVKPVFNEAQNDPNIKFIVSYGHQSAYTSARGRYGGSGTLKDIINGLREAYPKYMLDLSGHNHQYERYLHPNGLTTIINSTAGSYYRGWDDPAMPENCEYRIVHYGILILDFTDNSIKGRFVSSIGTSKSGADYKPLEEIISGPPGSTADNFIIYDTEGPNSTELHSNQVPKNTIIRNYPNPFSHSTKISYSLMKDGHIKIEIFDLLGQKIAVLFDDVKEQGEHFFEWNARDEDGNILPGGVYFAKINSGINNEIARLMLIH